MQAGRKVWGRDKTSSWGWRRADEPHLRLLRLRVDKAEDSWVDVTLLRHVNWLQDRVVEEGGLLYLDMAEMGTVGWARVLAVEACPPLEEGPGCLVTGTFCHSDGVVYDLRVSGESKPIGVTAGHPFWSADRQTWIPVGQLRIGERLEAEDGSTPSVESLTLREDPEPVYNIEVQGDHCYRVGQQGLLVHNASEPVWTGTTHESCKERIGHCPQLDGSSGFSATPAFSTMTSSMYYGIILDVEGAAGVEVSRYHELPTGFKAIVSGIGGGTDADRRILPPGWDRTANVGRSATIYRGHLLAKDLGGPGRVNDGGITNLVTQSRGTNLRVMRAVERGVTDLVNKGHKVYYQIIAVYGGGAIPTKLRIRACAKVDKEEYDATVVSHWEIGITL